MMMTCKGARSVLAIELESVRQCVRRFDNMHIRRYLLLGHIAVIVRRLSTFSLVSSQAYKQS